VRFAHITIRYVLLKFTPGELVTGKTQLISPNLGTRMRDYVHAHKDIETKQGTLALLEEGMTCREWSGQGPWKDTTEYWKARLKDQIKELQLYVAKMREIEAVG